MSQTRPRYRDIADHLEHALRSGAYKAGERLPSVRLLCRNWQTSITTVVSAYHLLERRGLVETRAQSGHYALPPTAPPEPDMLHGRPVPTDVSLGQLALRVMKGSFDPRLVPFGIAMPDPALLPSADIHRILVKIGREGTSGCDQYGVPPGSHSLRQVVARRSGDFGCAIGPEQLVTTAGGLEALTLALRATCKAGQTVAIESPMYYGLLQSIEALALRVIEIPCHPRNGISLESLSEAIDEYEISAVVSMSAGSNPLGAIASDDSKRELVGLLSDRRIPLIEDDVLGDLAHGPGRPRPAKAFDQDGSVLWCSSISKSASPGLRVGWIAAGRYQSVIEHLQFTNAVGPSPLTHEVAARFLAGGAYDRSLRRMRLAYAQRTAAMVAAVLRTFPPGTRVSQPSSGFCLWVELPAAVDAEELYAAAMRAFIAIAPGTLFSAKHRYRHFIRLSAARWQDDSTKAINRLAEIVDSLCRRVRKGSRPRDGSRS